MAFSAQVEVQGLENVLRQLRGIDERVRKKGLRKVVASASSKLAAAAKARVPRREPRSIPRNWSYAGNQLRRSIGRKLKSYGGTQVGIVGARLNFRIQVGQLTRNGPANSKKQGKKGDPIFVNPVKYLHLVLLGTAHSRGVNFLDQAGRAMAGEIQADAISIIDEAIGGGA